MELYENKELFKEIIIQASEFFNIDESLIEKDYYVTLVLRNAVRKIDGLVFKGGTSLSKGYHLINRFSEDVDLSLNLENFTQSRKRGAVVELINVIHELKLNLNNETGILNHTHGNYNCYEIEYPISFANGVTKPQLIVEMTYIQKSYPTNVRKISFMISDFLSNHHREDIIKEYDLESFNIECQSVERTLIDKAFALGDYYLKNQAIRNSRHIYDIHMIVSSLDDEALKNLKSFIEEIRDVRKKNKSCSSAQDDQNLNDILKAIVSNSFFKKDYEEITNKLLWVQCPYDTSIESIKHLIDIGIFDR